MTSEKLPITTEVVAVASTSKSTIKNPFLQLIRNVIAYTAYALVIESPFEFKSKMHYAEIANYPYGKTKNGNFIYTNSTNYNTTRVDVYNHFLVENKNLYGNDFGLDFRFLRRFAIAVNYLNFFEKINN